MNTVEVVVLLVLVARVAGFRLRQPMTNPPQLYSYLTPRQHMGDSVEYWPNKTSKALLYDQGKYTATFLLSRILWD
jgi:hypothetical protein